MWGAAEGFANFPNENALKSVLTLPNSSQSIRSIPIGQPAKPQIISETTPSPFLKAIIQSEQSTVKSLLKTASRIGPVAQKVAEKEAAYDADFIDNTAARLPGGASTLQGFTFALFFGSYIAFIIVIVMYVNAITGSGLKAGLTFLAFLIVGVILVAVVKRFG
jgi:hypothetical protein